MGRDDVVLEQGEILLVHDLKNLLVHELDRTSLQVGHFWDLGRILRLLFSLLVLLGLFFHSRRRVARL